MGLPECCTWPADTHERLGLKGGIAGEEREEGSTKRVDIGRRADFFQLACDLLGGPKPRGAHEHAGLGEAALRVEVLGDAEVGQQWFPGRSQDDVVGFDVAMNDPLCVDRR